MIGIFWSKGYSQRRLNTSAKLMKTANLIFITIAFAVLVLLSYFYFFAPPSETEFEKVKVGDSEVQVRSILGKPKRIARKGPLLSDVDFEYEYYIFPIPTVMCVGFKDGVVSKTYIMQSP